VKRVNATTALLFIVVVFLTGVVLKLTQTVVISMLIALLLAYVMDPVVLLLRRLRFLPLWLSVLITALLFLGMFFGFGIIIFNNLMDFAVRFPSYQFRFTAMVRDLIVWVEATFNVNVRTEILDQIRRIPVPSIIFNATRSIISILLRFLLVFFFSLLILHGKYGLIRKILRSYPGRRGLRMSRILIHIDEGLRKYLGVKTLASLVIGTSTTVVLLLFGVEFAIILGAVTFILNFIPTLGSTIATFLPVLVALIQWADPARPFWIFVTLTALQNLIGTVLEPKVMGGRLNLSLLVVLFSLLFWGWLWGPAGVLLAVPMTTSIRIVLANVPSMQGTAQLLEPLPRRRGDRSAFPPSRRLRKREPEPREEEEKAAG
jgi:AI-2 transport protein TqsA